MFLPASESQNAPKRREGVPGKKAPVSKKRPLKTITLAVSPERLNESVANHSAISWAEKV